MIKNKILIAGFCIITLIYTYIACDDPAKDNVIAVYDKQPVGLYLETRPEFSDWVDLLKYTEYYNILNINNNYTCFVPDNTAVSEYLKEKGYNKVTDMPKDFAQYLVKYSIIEGATYYNASFGNGRLIDSTASGDYLITKYREGGINSIYVNHYARIIEKDIEVTNGVIQVIDMVLDPILITVWDIVSQTERYSIFKEALEQTELHLNLQEIRVGLYKSYRTLLAVSDSIFHENGISSFQDLNTWLGNTSQDYINPENPLYKYVAYHIVDGMQAVSDLADFANDTKSKNVNTFAENELFSVTDQNGFLYINIDSEDEHSQFINWRYDVQARNGYVHEIDNLMPVFSPNPSTLLFEFTDYPEFRTIPFYRTWPATSSKEFFTLENKPADINWKTIPDGNYSIWYETRSNWSALMYRDIICVNLGDVGWIEFKLPQIVKGRYKISINRNVYSGRGTYQASIDGTRIGSTINFASGSTLLEIGLKEFKTTSTHTIRFSVVKKGSNDESMGLDYILFEPVD